MESLGQAARRLLGRLDRAAKAKNEIAGRVEQSESSNVFPDATERWPAPDADSIGDGFTVPGRVRSRPNNARQEEEIRDSAKPLALGRGGEVGSSCLAAPLRLAAANDSSREHKLLPSQCDTPRFCIFEMRETVRLALGNRRHRTSASFAPVR